MVMKSIILTYAGVSEEEQKILTETNIFKLALNQHGAIYNPDARIITDYVLPQICAYFPETIISVRQRLRTPSDRIIYPNIEFKGATIIAGVEYLISKGYDEILIVGDNTVNMTEFQNLVNDEMSKYTSRINIYQYTQGNFNLPVKTIKEFCKGENYV